MHKSNMTWLLAGILGLALVIWPFFTSGEAIYYQVLGMACLYASLALAWNLYALTGAISLGHAAFFGLGAYGSALLERHLLYPPPLAIVLGAMGGAFYAILWSIAFKRLRNAYLALGTLASVEIPKAIIDNWPSFTYGSLGIVGIPSLFRSASGNIAGGFGDEMQAQYYLLLFFMFFVGWIHQRAMTTKWGWAIRSIRENELAASMLGVDVFRTRFFSLLLSAYLTSACGAIYGHLIGMIEPTLVFSLHLSALPLVLSIFGGRYQFYGPVLGALVLYPVDQLVFHPWLPAGHAAYYGLVIILSVFFFPHGIAAWLQQHLKSA
jgi:branched-chain amino acid transport system permease protein